MSARDHPPPSSATPESVKSDWERWLRIGLVELGLFLVIAATLISYPSVPGADLDPSWRQVLGYVARNGLQFGPDIVFTYGPLGYLFTPSVTDENALVHLYWQLITSGGFAAAILAFSHAFRGPARGAVLFFFIVIAGPQPEAVTLYMLILAALAYARWGVERAWVWALPLTAFLAFASLEKFTHIMVAAGVIPVLCAQAILSGRRRAAFALAVSYLIFLSIGWSAVGQSLSSLPSYLLGSLQLSSEYSRSMGLSADVPTLWLGLLVVAAMGIYLATQVRGREHRERKVALVLVALVGAFLSWKHGFVRADAHTLSHFQFQLFLVVVLPVFFRGISPTSTRSRYALIAVVVLAVGGMGRTAPTSVTDAVQNWNFRVLDTKDRLFHEGRWQNEVLQRIGHARNLYQLPEASHIIGAASVDVLGHEQGYAIFNQLNYTPRPAFQSYFATHPALTRRNEAFYRGQHGPQFVLQKLQTIDQRLPALDDALATLAVYQNYDLIRESRRFLIWQRRAEVAPDAGRELISELTATWDEEISIPSDTSAPIWCEIDVKPSLVGRVKGLLYKPQELRIHAMDKEGNSMGYRYLPSAGRIGFLVAPHLVSNHDLIALQTNDAPNRLQSLRLLPGDNSSGADFRKTFAVSFYRVAPMTRNRSLIPPDPQVTFGSFSDMPLRYEALYAIAELEEKGGKVVAAHPPSELEFQRPAAALRLSGGFGFFASAFAQDTQITDGVGFLIDWFDADGNRRILLERFLNPSNIESDKEEQKFDLLLPDGPGVVRLRTTPGPGYDLSFDWVYWRDVKFTPSRSP